MLSKNQTAGYRRAVVPGQRRGCIERSDWERSTYRLIRDVVQLDRPAAGIPHGDDRRGFREPGLKSLKHCTDRMGERFARVRGDSQCSRAAGSGRAQ